MAYRIRLANGVVLDGLASSVACVLLTKTNADAIDGNDFPEALYYATNPSGNTFNIFSVASGALVIPGTGGPLVNPVTLPKTTLAVTVSGARVFVDDGSGVWRGGKVVMDGVSAILPDGTVLPVGTRASSVAPAELPSARFVPQLVATASDGSEWFNTGVGGFVKGGVMSTIGALAAGTTAFVERAADTWSVELL